MLLGELSWIIFKIMLGLRGCLEDKARIVSAAMNHIILFLGDARAMRKDDKSGGDV
jgi:hypothetical protein